MHNTLRKDRYVPTNFTEELSQLGIKDNGAYTLGCQVADEWLPSGCQAVAKRLPQVSIDKVSIDKDSLVESSVVETTATATEEDKLKLIGGNLGKGVVYLTDRQFNTLIDKLGLDGFNRYVERLADYIIQKKAHIKSHYNTILKWYEEDTKS
jgi:hypothetical protein